MLLLIAIAITALFLVRPAAAGEPATTQATLVVLDPVGVGGPHQMNTSVAREAGKVGSWRASSSYELSGRAGQTVSLEASTTLWARSAGGGLLGMSLSQGLPAPPGPGEAQPSPAGRRLHLGGLASIPSGAGAGMYTGSVIMLVNYN